MNINDFLCTLKQYGKENNIPNISEQNAQFIRKILRENHIIHLLEIGTANGYSTIHFAQELLQINGHITTIDFSQKAYEDAQEHFEMMKLTHMITQYYWDAREIIPFLNTTFDGVFIDGLKKASLDFLQLVWNHIQDDGIIIIDDVIKFRYKMENLYEYLHKKGLNYKIVQTDTDDGIMIIQKNYQ